MSYIILSVYSKVVIRLSLCENISTIPENMKLRITVIRHEANKNPLNFDGRIDMQIREVRDMMKFEIIMFNLNIL